ncbi:putative 5-methylcytosine methyltransferase [Streptomyces sp. Tu6071]|uniref:DNA cytosine methyltransferase n=1 Tax=unclassified Streptomyces TaxID=2593676 RepID=UPI00020E56BE|nr:DNA cytosine methyltransferase [Streptomyces sp. Tu6071]EGJ75065.1 putative 5-methylcytosine methyltransferase [Streptomyces sp. Tu6071]
MGEATAIDLCAGVGGQALGLEQAGFRIAAAVDVDVDSCATLRANRPEWQVIRGDLKEIEPVEYDCLDGADLLSCGLPRSPYTIGGKQQGTADPRDALSAALDMAAYVRPSALLLENIPGFLTSPRFAAMREAVAEAVEDLGFVATTAVLDAKDFGVSQRREHGFLVAMSGERMKRFSWPVPLATPCPTLGETLRASMGARGWPGADDWADHADQPAPTIVGGATGRGGADLGGTRSKKAWRRWDVFGGSLGNEVPGPEFRIDRDLPDKDGLVSLTVPQVALLQGFTADWRIAGRKTSTYRQISQTTPPPVAAAVGREVRKALGR